MAALGDFAGASYQMLDHSGERKSFKIPIAPVTLANIAQTLLDLTDVETAIDAVTLGNRSRNEFGNWTNVTNTKPANANAQVETEILVRLVGVTSEAPDSFRIATADYAAFNWLGDEAIIAGGGASVATTNLVDAINTVYRHPTTGEAMEVVGISVAD